MFSIISMMGLDEHLVSAFRIEGFVLVVVYENWIESTT